MPTTTQIGGLLDQTLHGDSVSGSTNKIYGDLKKLTGNTVGGNDIINGGNNGAINYLYGDAHSMQGNAKGGADRITGGSNGSTNYIYGDAYSMECNVVGGNDILIGGLNSKNIIYGDAHTMSGGAKGGDDDISLASNTLIQTNDTSFNISGGPPENVQKNVDMKIENNNLVGDAKSIVNSSAGVDSISIGNGVKLNIGFLDISVSDNAQVDAVTSLSLDISKNTLIGDANSIKDGSAGNDILTVGNNIANKISTTTVRSFSANSTANATSSTRIALTSNRLVGDAENINCSRAGSDTISVGNNLQSTVAGVSTISNNGGLVTSLITLHFIFSDNDLLGDADSLKNSHAGDDTLSIGNHVLNSLGNIVSDTFGGAVSPVLPITTAESAYFTFSDNTLLGDARIIENSTAGNDIIGIGNNFQNSLGSIANRGSNYLSANASESVSYIVSNNLIIGDAKNMSHASSGKDTIGLGNNFKNIFGAITNTPTNSLEYYSLAQIDYLVTSNKLIGDAITIKNSSANDDVLEVGNNFDSASGNIVNAASYTDKSTVSSVLNFKLSDNILIGDAESMKNASSGNDSIKVGNNFNNNFGVIAASATASEIKSVTTVVSDYVLTKNHLVGDANTMQDSSGGNDVLTIGNDIFTSIASIDTRNYQSGDVDFKVLLNFSLTENALFGDAEKLLESSGGHDTLDLGNNFKNFLGVTRSGVNLYSKLEFSFSDVLTLSDNRLYGDAKIIKNGSGGNDIINFGNGYASKLGNFSINTFNVYDVSNVGSVDNSANFAALVAFSLTDNILYGDAETMTHAAGGNDQLNVGNGIKNEIGSLTHSVSLYDKSIANIESNFLLTDNTLFGDAKTMSYGLGGNDIINLGNDFYSNFVGGSLAGGSGSLATSAVVVALNLSDNNIFGDAQSMTRSQGGDDVISVAHNFKSTVSPIINHSSAYPTVTSVVSNTFSMINNALYGDAESMSYSKGGNDTLSIGVGIMDDVSLTLDIKDNVLYGDAKTMQRSQGGNDTLTGADGKGSVTYLYGDAKFTDGNSGAGDDTLHSGRGNDHMWGDFGGRLNHNAPYVNYSTGKDSFVFGDNNGNDIIYDFQRCLDKIVLQSIDGIDSFDDLTISSSIAQPSNSVIDFGNGNSITLVGVAHLDASDFLFVA